MSSHTGREGWRKEGEDAGRAVAEILQNKSLFLQMQRESGQPREWT